MSLFSELLGEVADANRYPLGSSLLRAKLLGSRLRARSFRRWVDAELEGYPATDCVPDYRKVRVTIYGQFSGPFGAAMRNVKLSVSTWSPQLRAAVEWFY